MTHSERATPAEHSHPTLSPTHNRSSVGEGLSRPLDIRPLAGSALAGVMLLIASESTVALVAGAPAAIATEGAGPLGLGAIVGAAVAGGFALRERFRRK